MNQNFRILSNLLCEMEQQQIGNSDDIISQTSAVYSYLSKEHLNSLLNNNGLISLNQYLKKTPDDPDLVSKFGNTHGRNCFHNRNNIEPCVNKIHPDNSRGIRVFFSRVPERLPNTNNFHNTHVPVKISTRKLMAAKEKFKLYGINFPGVSENKWIELKEEHVGKLNQLHEQWGKIFRENKTENFFESIPHGSLVCESGIIPKFAVKVLD